MFKITLSSPRLKQSNGLYFKLIGYNSPVKAYKTGPPLGGEIVAIGIIVTDTNYNLERYKFELDQNSSVQQ